MHWTKYFQIVQYLILSDSLSPEFVKIIISELLKPFGTMALINI